MKKIVNFYHSWKNGEDAMAAVEAAFIFPLMLTILLSIYDLGFGIVTNQKAIRASQVIADLVTRTNVLSNSDLNEAIEGGRLAFEPFGTETFGVDVVSIRFDEDADTEIVWRETRNMATLPNAQNAVASLATAEEGVVMVTVNYTYTPRFAGFVVGEIAMSEVAFSRGRRSSVVTLSGA